MTERDFDKEEELKHDISACETEIGDRKDTIDYLKKRIAEEGDTGVRMHLKGRLHDAEEQLLHWEQEKASKEEELEDAAHKEKNNGD